MFIANAFAQKFYSEFMMQTEDGSIGLAYFKERGFYKSTIEKFQLGFAPDAKDAFAQYALKNAFQKDILLKAGLITEHEYGLRDFFRNRVIFPIHNLTGKILGFAGRILAKDDKSPKYINTAENEIYQKSKILYGAFFAKNAVRKADECFLVEGYTDVISLHQAGIENTMASSGTSLTSEQIRMVKRMTQNITLLYDGDAAGIKAALRGTDMILEEGMNVKIVLLPDGEDPDSFVKKVGREEFLSFIQSNRKDIILFKTSLFARETHSDPVQRAALINEILASISKIPDPIQRSVYVKECSQIFNLNEYILTVEINKLRRKNQRDPTVIAQTDGEKKQKLHTIHSEQAQETVSTQKILEEGVIRLLIEYGDWQVAIDENTFIEVTRYILEEIEGIDFDFPLPAKIFDIIKNEFSKGVVLNTHYFTTHEDEEIRTFSLNIIAEKYQVSENWWNKHKVVVPEKRHIFVRDIESSIFRLKQFHNLKQLRLVEEEIRLSQSNSQMSEEAAAHLRHLMKKHVLLIEQQKEFAKLLGNTVYHPAT
jgi:DNA primase